MSLPSSSFLNRLIRFLMPFFLDTDGDVETAQQEILETLASYGARTRAELLSAAQIVAYSMSALEALNEAKGDDLSPAMRLRLRGCANGMNRASQQNETTLAKRIASETQADPVSSTASLADRDGVVVPAEPPTGGEPHADTRAIAPLPAVEASYIEQAKADFAALRAEMAALGLPIPGLDRHGPNSGDAVLGGVRGFGMQDAHPSA